MDESATITTLDAAMRALTYYLDVSVDCCKRIVQHEGVLNIICGHLESAEMHVESSRNFAMQCIKVLELVCTREAAAVHAAGGLQGALAFLTNGGDAVFKDRLLSALDVARSCCRWVLYGAAKVDAAQASRGVACGTFLTQILSPSLL